MFWIRSRMWCGFLGLKRNRRAVRVSCIENNIELEVSGVRFAPVRLEKTRVSGSIPGLKPEH